MIPIQPAKTALVIIDLQNDFLHPQGAYARGGATSDAIAALPARVKPVLDTLRAQGGLVVSTQFTLWTRQGGEPIISPHLKQLRPFLRKGDFAMGGFGHSLVDSLQPADVSVCKVAYSAFFNTQLEWVLRRAGIETLVFCGIVTNGGVASSVRDAHVRDFEAIVLEDGCAAFRPEIHDTSIADMRNIAQVMSCAELNAALGG